MSLSKKEQLLISLTLFYSELVEEQINFGASAGVAKSAAQYITQHELKKMMKFVIEKTPDR